MKDISNVFMIFTLFCDTTSVSRTFIKNDIKIGYLNKNKSKKSTKNYRRLRTFEENNINTSTYKIDELISKN